MLLRGGLFLFFYRPWLFEWLKWDIWLLLMRALTLTVGTIKEDCTGIIWSNLVQLTFWLFSEASRVCYTVNSCFKLCFSVVATKFWYFKVGFCRS